MMQNYSVLCSFACAAVQESWDRRMYFCCLQIVLVFSIHDTMTFVSALKTGGFFCFFGNIEPLKAISLFFKFCAIETSVK